MFSALESVSLKIFSFPATTVDRSGKAKGPDSIPGST